MNSIRHRIFEIASLPSAYGYLYNWYAATLGSDWFLPSDYEMAKMYLNLKAQNVGGFVNGFYWCSTEYDSSYAHRFDFSNGTVLDNSHKGNTYNVRACRSFISATVYNLRDIGPTGGLIFHGFNNGDGTFTWYEAAISDQSASIKWSNITNAYIGTTSPNVGEGQNNTNEIIAQAGHTTSAAKLCADYSVSIAPTGWHVPTKDEFDTLRIALGGDNSGGKLKAISGGYWLSPNTGATDEYGFTAVGSGERAYDTGEYASLRESCIGWTATEYDSSTGVNWNINYLYDNISPSSGYYTGSNKKAGLCIRLLKDNSTDPGTMTGNDGVVYPTVKIGNQVWMAVNSRETKYSDGSDISLVEDNDDWIGLSSGAYCIYKR